MIATNLTFICCVYKEKSLNDSWIATFSIWVYVTLFSISRFYHNTTNRSRIRSDQKRLFFAVYLYTLSFFANTPFKLDVTGINWCNCLFVGSLNFTINVKTSKYLNINPFLWLLNLRKGFWWNVFLELLFLIFNSTFAPFSL